MKTNLFIILAALVLASCSTPKYTYKFDYHDYNAGRKEKQAMKEVAANPGPVEIQPENLVAEAPSVTEAPAGSTETMPTPKSQVSKSSAPLTLAKSEAKALIKQAKAVVKEMARAKKSGDIVQTDQSTKAMDGDLKMSLIFLVASIAAGLFVGVNATIFGIIASILFIIALIFFIKWLLKQ